MSTLPFSKSHVTLETDSVLPNGPSFRFNILASNLALRDNKTQSVNVCLIHGTTFVCVLDAKGKATLYSGDVRTGDRRVDKVGVSLSQSVFRVLMALARFNLLTVTQYDALLSAHHAAMAYSEFNELVDEAKRSLDSLGLDFTATQLRELGKRRMAITPKPLLLGSSSVQE